MDDFENLSEEDIQVLMQLGIIPEQMSGLQEQIQAAQSLRNRPSPQGTNTGRVYVAANPLEHIARAWEGIKAGKDLDKLRAEQQKLLAEQIRGRSIFFNRYRQQPQVNQTDVDMGY